MNPRNGKNASSTKPGTWGTRKEAEAACRKHGGKGIGVVLTTIPNHPEWRIGAFDMDACRHPVTGVLESWAKPIASRFANHMLEVSPSKTGFKAFFLFKASDLSREVLEADGRSFTRDTGKGKAEGIELFLQKPRYCTVTEEELFPHSASVRKLLGPQSMIAMSDDDLKWLITRGKRFKADATISAEHASHDDTSLEQHVHNNTLVFDGDTKELRKVLSDIPAENNEHYRDWLHVVQAIHFETGGSDEGLEIAHQWSEQCSNYDYEELDYRWTTFGKSGKYNLRGSYLLKLAKLAKSDQIAAAIRATPFEHTDPTTLPRRKWLYGHLMRGTTSATVAQPGLGKSSLTVTECLAMATGRPLLKGDKAHDGPVNVWYINQEESREELERRFAAACLHFGINSEDIGGRLFFNGNELEIVIAEESTGGFKINVPIVAAVKAEITRLKIDILAIDPFISFHRVNENDNTKIDAVVKTWGRLATETNCAIELVAHVRKASMGQDSYTVEDIRGASAMLGAVRSARVLNRMTSTMAEKLGLEHHRLYFRVDDGKANYAPPHAHAKWRHIVNVGLGNGMDEFNRDEDRVGVVEHWSPPDPRADIGDEDISRVLDEIKSGKWRKDAQAKAWVGHAIAKALRWSLDDPQQKSMVKALQADWLRDGTLKTEIRKDSKREDREFVVVNTRRTTRRDLFGDDFE